MVARITTAQARKLGIDTKLAAKRTVRRTARGAYLTRCVQCGEVFTRSVDEDNHVIQTKHARYRLILPGE